MALGEARNLVMSTALVAMFVSTIAAHEYHASTAEVEHNPESCRVEVALQVIPEDLEAALSRDAGQAGWLDKTGHVDQQIGAYLSAHFRVVGPSGESQPIVWVGKEVSHRAAWLYFEIPVEENATEKATSRTLENRILLDLEPGQINTVLFRNGEHRETWTLTGGSPRVELPLGRH